MSYITNKECYQQQISAKYLYEFWQKGKNIINTEHWFQIYKRFSQQ